VVTVRRLYLLKAALATGRTTPYIAVAHLIKIELRQIGLGVVLAVIQFPNARPVPGNRLLDRAESFTVSLLRAVVQAALGGMQASVTAPLARAEPMA
jgi:hypothetical protein